jgi:hypothetical protein
MTEREKFERIFLPLVVDPKGEPARYGFTRYRLSDKWAHPDEDLFVHEASDGGIVLYRCLQEADTMPSPWCRRDVMLTDRLTLTYRFKRARLSDWRDIDRGVTKLIATFRNGAPALAPAMLDSEGTTPPQDNLPAAPAAAQTLAPSAAPGAEAPAQPAPPAADDFKLLPQGAPRETAPVSDVALPVEPKVHKVDPNADPDPDTDSAPAGTGNMPTALAPPVPPPAEGGH